MLKSVAPSRSKLFEVALELMLVKNPKMSFSHLENGRGILSGSGLTSIEVGTWWGCCLGEG